MMKEQHQKVSPAIGKNSSDMGNIHKEITIDNRIFLKGFKLDTKEQDLENVFKTYGLIVETKIIRDSFNGQSKGFGFITFDSQQVAQEVLNSVESIQLDDTEITVGPAKMRRLPPHTKPFRQYNRYTPGPNQAGYVPPPPTTAPVHPQYLSMPYFVSPDGFFTWFPNSPYQKIPYPDSVPPITDGNTDVINGSPVSSPMEIQQNMDINKLRDNIPHDNNHHGNSSVCKYESNIPPPPNPSSQHVTELTNGKINNNEIKPSMFPPNIVTTEMFHANGGGNHFPNSIYVPSTTTHFNGSLNSSPSTFISNSNEIKHPSNIFFNGVPYENGTHPTVMSNAGIDLTMITNGISTMMPPPSYHYVPVTSTHFVPNTGMEYGKPESNGLSETSAYPPPLKHPNTAHGYTKLVNKPIKECTAPPPSPNENNGNIALKTQNFVFMSTGPGKVNRVVVH